MRSDAIALLFACAAGCGARTALDDSEALSHDAGSPESGALDAPVGVDACGACLDTTTSWGQAGGVAAATSSLAPCRTYSHTSQIVPGAGSCTTLLPCEGPPPTVSDVERALADPDVVAALAGATTVYGSDARGCDGTIFEVQTGGRTIDIGGQCAASPSCSPPGTPCVPVPAGLAALETTLLAVDMQARQAPACASLGP